GLASNGLHTNGYSLARKILFDKMRLKPNSCLPGSKITVGQELLRVHKNYQPLLAKVPVGVIKGLAHITGGGLIDNLPRILPSNGDERIETKAGTSRACSKCFRKMETLIVRKCIKCSTWALEWSRLWRSEMPEAQCRS